MGNFGLSVAAPHATDYDEDYPTRSVEKYCHALHEVLQDMEDNNFYLSDDAPSSTEKTTIRQQIHDMIEEVFDYAKSAIDSYRGTGDPSLSKPTKNDISKPTLGAYPTASAVQWRIHAECFKTMYMIYYMWETQEDPLLLKEKLQELLIAWPLLDTTIELSSELGQQFKVYPSWKNADLDL